MDREYTYDYQKHDYTMHKCVVYALLFDVALAADIGAQSKALVHHNQSIKWNLCIELDQLVI